MSTLTANTFLARNLACLGERNAELAQQLASVQSPSSLEFLETPEGNLSATLEGRQLCSRHRPYEEARRQVDDIDLVEHAAVVVLGFGLGHHVRRLAERAEKATLLIVFEPDLGLLRSVFERIDHSEWMKDALLLLIADADDRGVLARKLEGAESILAQGVHFHEHLPSRARLAETAQRFSRLFTEFISAAKTTLMTTLMRSVDTTRNLMLNIDHYAAGAGIRELHDIAANKPAIVVSAGPSLRKNMHLLKSDEVRNRCVIIAVQTTLKPLLAAGIKPHFVTALDYHEISKRFYEDLTPEQIRDVTLIADPKAHPVILDAFPGPVRCCANGFLDKLLGPMKREMGDLPAGATVAHLAMYFARYLGCNPIAMIGQDLGFSDGLYYAPAPGVAIHDVWAPELNPFNTIEMMEWQRIVRHRTHLRKVKDVHGRSIYTDLQMHTYLQQFERDFAQYKRDGLTIIDASEGGVAKQHTRAMPLQSFIDQHVIPSEPLQGWKSPSLAPDAQRLDATRARLGNVRGEIRRLRELSNDTARLLREMLADQHDQAKLSRLFQRIDHNRKQVERRLESLELLNVLNQLGVFNRMKADRRLHMQKSLTPLQKQRSQLERDLTNVTWIADAADEFLAQLDSSEQLLGSTRSVSAGDRTRVSLASGSKATGAQAETKRETRTVAALIAIDPDRNGLGLCRSLDEPFNGRPVLQATLERLGQSKWLKSIILISPRDFDAMKLIDTSRIQLPVELEQTEGSPFGPEHAAIAAARLWADSCWRGGIAGVSAYDEALCPRVMNEIMQRRSLDAALIVAPDWPLIQVTEPGGCDDVIARYLEHPQQHNLVFTQAPPGLCGCLISAPLMQELSLRNRLSTVGGLLIYQPHAPQGDPIARDVNVQIQHEVRQSVARVTVDSRRQKQLLQHVTNENDAQAIVKSISQQLESSATPRHVVLELCTDRLSHGRFRRHASGEIHRPRLSLDMARQLFTDLSGLECDDLLLTLDGVGDPLLHPEFDAIIQIARASGVRGVHVRTELLADRDVLKRLLQSDVDVISVDLNADRAATYISMMGADRFKEALLNLEFVIENRRKLTDHSATAALALPWVVPHLQRCSETYEDIDSFFDRWQQTLGCAVIEGIPRFDSDPELARAVVPPKALHRDALQRLTIFSDGSVPFDQWDWPCTNPAGVIGKQSIRDIWRRVVAHQRKLLHA